MRVTSSLDGMRLAFEVHGTGTPSLVLVHGWSCDRSYWKGQVGSLARSFQVVTLDLAGHGDSGQARVDWTIEAFGADVVAVADELGLESMILVGHSMGGEVVLEAARRLVGRVAGLVWLDTYQQLASFRSPQQVEERLAPFRADFGGTTEAFVRSLFHPKADPSLVRRVAERMAVARPEIALAALESDWSFGPRAVAILKELELPVIAINPEVPLTDLESLRRHGVDVLLMPGVGHFPMMEDPERLNDLLLEAIGSIQRRAARSR